MKLIFVYDLPRHENLLAILVPKCDFFCYYFDPLAIYGLKARLRSFRRYLDISYRHF